jgi:hypothetical protein
MEYIGFIFWGVIVALVTVIVVLILKEESAPLSSDDDLYCPHCGTVGQAEFCVSGSVIVETLLWVFLLLPGIIYSIWRRSTKSWVCPKCGMTGMIPLDSPIAQKALGEKACN